MGGRKSLDRLVLEKFKYKNVDQLRCIPLVACTSEVIWLRLYFPDANSRKTRKFLKHYTFIFTIISCCEDDIFSIIIRLSESDHQQRLHADPCLRNLIGVKTKIGSTSDCIMAKTIFHIFSLLQSIEEIGISNVISEILRFYQPNFSILTGEN